MLVILAALLLVSNAGAQSLSPTLSGANATIIESALAGRAAARAAAREASEGRDDGWGTTAVIPRVMGDRVTPDAEFTPGGLCTASDPNFKEYRYAEKISYCNRVVTQKMKKFVAAHYGVPEKDWSDYEFDHLIPLAIGGNSSVDNLWPQPHGDPDGSNGKDRLEMQLYLKMKNGEITQAEAVRRIYAWFTAALILERALRIPTS